MKKHVLPTQLPFLSTTGTVLLPGGLLPFHATTAKEKKVVQQALKANRYIGVIQPALPNQDPKALSAMGCLGQITTFTEGQDDSYFVVLKGLTRFEILEDLEPATSSKRVLKVQYHKLDPHESPFVSPQERLGLLKLLGDYLETHGMKVNWDDVAQASDETLITSLAMLCPFNAQEKQALLESPTTQDRYQMVMAFLEAAQLKNNPMALH